MRDADCVAFLQWCLPKLGLRWPGFRRVRGTVCERVARRIRDLGLADLGAYCTHLEATPEEWPQLEALCRIPISRFWRDRGVYDAIAHDVLPALARAAAARGDEAVEVWSAGCASGEEPFSLRLAWSLAAETMVPELAFRIVATDVEPQMLARARAGIYRESSLRDLPDALVNSAFVRQGELYEVRPALRRDVTFLEQDIRAAMPDGPFDLILVRNLVFTYFDQAKQKALLQRLCERIRPGGAFVIGAHERLPEPRAGLVSWDGAAEVFRRGSSVLIKFGS